MTLDSVLLEHLKLRPVFKESAWVHDLEPRKKEEAVFHNFERDRDDAAVIRAQQEIDVHANRKYYSIAGRSIGYVDDWLKTHAPGRVVLDYACGNGKFAMRAATLGASLVVGLDISDVSIRNAQNAAKLAGLEDVCTFIQGDCEATELPDRSIDIIICSGMLHHLDLGRAYPELRRLLRPGGVVLGIEALGHNPLIQLYRNRTPHLRTEWEAGHILRWRDIKRAEKWFDLGEVRFWHLFDIGAVPLRHTPIFKPAVGALTFIDRVILSLPLIQLMAWQVTFELHASSDR
jgi:ubiquinone/menaquinone biosynthesis C-methylase UbiE